MDKANAEGPTPPLTGYQIKARKIHGGPYSIPTLSTQLLEVFEGNCVPWDGDAITQVIRP
jgi:hypothetical protein